VTPADNSDDIDAAIVIGCVAVLIFFVMPEIVNAIARFL